MEHHRLSSVVSVWLVPVACENGPSCLQDCSTKSESIGAIILQFYVSNCISVSNCIFCTFFTSSANFRQKCVPFLNVNVPYYDVCGLVRRPARLSTEWWSVGSLVMWVTCDITSLSSLTLGRVSKIHARYKLVDFSLKDVMWKVGGLEVFESILVH